MWRSVPFRIDISLSCLVPSPDFTKSTVQIEADLMPFCSSWIASEYLPRCHSHFDRHSRCVKPKSGLCQMLRLNSSEASNFHTLRWTRLMEKSARVLAFFLVSCCLNFFFFICSLLSFNACKYITLQPNT